MNTPANESTRSKKRSSPRTIILLIAILSSPLACCSGVIVLNALPDSVIPPVLDFFTAEAHIKNNTNETLYLTPITTTFGKPQVIRQSGIRQRDFPIAPGGSLVLEYDAADAALAGIVVCQTDDKCRLLPVDYSNEYQLTSFESLPDADPEWVAIVRTHPDYDFSIVIWSMLGLLPLALFFTGLWMGREQKGKG